MSRQNRNTSMAANVLRITVVAAAIILQLLLIILLVGFLRQNAVYVYALIEIGALINIFFIVSRDRNPSFTIAWMLVIFLLPVFGHLLYLIWGRRNSKNRNYSRIRAAHRRAAGYLKDDGPAHANLAGAAPSRKRFARYLSGAGYPLHQNTECTYYPLGELQFDAMCADMENAEKFIFLEYFILHSGELWERVRDILIRKAKAGVEIRIMYDDCGTILATPADLSELSEYGIRLLCYNPIHKYIGKLYINYRNHQKITVVDGNIGYTGGTNIADEYINIRSKVGHFKDTGIRLYGAAVYNLTAIFLQMWDGETGEESDYGAYRPTAAVPGGSFVQPYADGPTNGESNPAEGMYQGMVANAQDYLYVTTPYLITDNGMNLLLSTAAQSGVDVRIITPKICDHWFVHMVTQSNYSRLLRAGVKIYEYTPGFIHAKTMLSDDDHAITGSINMDYRSFYFHFENAVWICGDPAVLEIKKDFLETIAKSEEILLEQWEGRPWYLRAVQGFFRIFAVML